MNPSLAGAFLQYLGLGPYKVLQLNVCCSGSNTRCYHHACTGIKLRMYSMLLRADVAVLSQDIDICQRYITRATAVSSNV